MLITIIAIITIVAKSNNRFKRRKAKIGSLLLKLLSSNIKTKKKHKRQTNKHRKNIKLKAMGNLTPTMNHYPRHGYMEDTHLQFDNSCELR